MTTAHPARIYNHLIGGEHNYGPDRAVAEQLLAINPLARAGALGNRGFALRAVRTMVADLGIDQILDLGAGIPTSPAVHEVARAEDPATVVAYVDNDPIVLAHDRALLAVEPGVVTALGDLTDPPSVLGAPELDGLIDWSRPVGVVLAAVFHFVPEDRDPTGVVAAYRDRMAPGSAVAISMLTTEGGDRVEMDRAQRDYRATQGLTFRDRARIEEFFAGFEVVEPGVVHPARWRPGQAPPIEGAESVAMLAGLGVRR